MSSVFHPQATAVGHSPTAPLATGTRYTWTTGTSYIRTRVSKVRKKRGERATPSTPAVHQAQRSAQGLPGADTRM